MPWLDIFQTTRHELEICRRWCSHIHLLPPPKDNPPGPMIELIKRLSYQAIPWSTPDETFWLVYYHLQLYAKQNPISHTLFREQMGDGDDRRSFFRQVSVDICDLRRNERISDTISLDMWNSVMAAVQRTIEDYSEEIGEH